MRHDDPPQAAATPNADVLAAIKRMNGYFIFPGR